MTTAWFPNDNFSSVYWIFIKLDHMIALWKRKKPFILGSLGQRSRSPLLSITFLPTWLFPKDNFSSVCWIFTKLGHMIPLWKGNNPIYLGSLPLYRLIIYIDGRILWCTHFLFEIYKAVMVIGLYELLGNPTILLSEPPGPLMFIVSNNRYIHVWVYYAFFT